MKKALFSLVFIATSLSWMSCKKVYTCRCVTTFPNTVNKVTNEYDMGKVNRKDAREECNKRSTPSSFSGVTAKIDCQLLQK